MNPAALEKAQSLVHYASDQGAELRTFVLALTPHEGLELIDWLLKENPDNEVLAIDVEIAQRTGDPFPVLEHFQLLGLAIAPANLVLN